MIYETLRRGTTDKREDGRSPFGWWTLIVLAFATSVDALVAGLTLPFLGVPIGIAALTIGVTTATLSAAGVCVGRRFGAQIGRKLELFGGVLLIGLGAKILVEHLRPS